MATRLKALKKLKGRFMIVRRMVRDGDVSNAVEVMKIAYPDINIGVRRRCDCDTWQNRRRKESCDLSFLSRTESGTR